MRAELIGVSCFEASESLAATAGDSEGVDKNLGSSGKAMGRGG
jgi:hypothetical protein